MENVRAGAELEEELGREGLFRTVFYEVGIGIALCDLDGRVLACNPALQRMLGRSAEQLDTLTIGQLSYPADIAEEADLFQQLLEGRRRQYQMKKRYLHKDGHIVWGRLTVSLVRDGAGEPQCAIGLVEDITEQEQAEEARREACAQLQQGQLRLAQSTKLAAIGELVASVAHELKDPLTVILGYAELLLKEIPAEDPHYKDVEAIAGEAHRTHTIIRSLLGLSRQSQHYRAPADISELLRQVLEAMCYHLRERGIQVAEFYGANLGRVSVDDGQIKEVLLNLITNASQAMPAGGTLSLRTARVGAEVSVAITDTGVGISQENLGRLFEPFFSTRPSGTGLGLTISQKLVQKHGGRITVISQEGQGSTFTVWLPVEESTTARDE